MAVRRIGDHVITIALRCGLRRRHFCRRLHHHVLLGTAFVGVIGTGGEEKQRAAHPHFPRIVRQVLHTDAVGRRHHHVTRALRAIPVAAREEVILATVGHAVVTVGEAINHMAGAILRPRAPAVAMPIRATWPAVVIGVAIEAATWACAIPCLPMRVAVVAARDVLIVALARLLGLPNRVRATLNRQIIRRLRCWPRRLGTLRATLPLPAAVRRLLGAIKVLVLRARRMVLELWVLWPRLVILRARLIVLLPPAFRASFMLTAAF